jgi:gliding motility-associated-like protein
MLKHLFNKPVLFGIGLLAFNLLPKQATAQGFIVNEASNGSTGSTQEYIELLSIGSAGAATASLDARGWIIDDNNGEFSGNFGIASGHFRITSGCSALSNLPVGSLVVVYNANDRHPLLPADDPTDSNGDNVYIIPHTNACIEKTSTLPTAANNIYSPVTYSNTALADWASIMALANGGDAVQVRRPNGAFQHGFCYGASLTATFPSFPAAFGGGQSFNVSIANGSNKSYIFGCGDWTNVSNFSEIASAASTPGASNNTANSDLIQKIRTGAFDYTNLANPNNCSNITVTPPPCGASLATTPANCRQSDGRINLAPQGGAPFTFAWSNGATTQNLTGVPGGTYSVTLTDAVGCVFVAAGTVSTPDPIVRLSSSITDGTCGGNNGAAAVQVVGTGAPFSYSWSNGATGASISGLSGGNYTVVARDRNGCTITETFSITAPPGINAFVLANGTIGCAPVIGTLTPNPTGGRTPYRYSWSDGSTNSTFSSNQVGTYSLTVTDADNCIRRVSANLVNASAPVLNAFISVSSLNSVTVSGGQTVNLGALITPTANSYTWSAGTEVTLSNPSQANAQVVSQADGTFPVTLRVTDVNGCTATETVSVTYRAAVAFPTAFSPNGDNTNDKYRPLYIGSSDVLQFRVYNRWGQLVYDDPKLTEGGWNGEVNGTAQPRDTYIYVIEYNDTKTNTVAQQRGEFTLIR